MSKFNFDEYKGKYGMHCKTEEEAIDFCKVMHQNGMRWCTAEKYIDNNNLSDYKEETVYCFNEGEYCRKDYAEDYGYKILEWSDFMNKCFEKSDLRNGDFIEYKDGNLGVVSSVELGVVSLQSGMYSMLENFNDDFTCKYNNMYISKVYRPTKSSECCFNFYTSGELMYDKNKDGYVEMTVDEISKALGKKVKVV